MKKANLILYLMISTLITLIVYYQVQSIPIEIEKVERTVLYKPEKIFIETPEEEPIYYQPVFSINKIDDITYNRIKDQSFKDNHKISRDDLRYLNISYWGFDDKRHEGEMIVHREVADDVIAIFKTLYDHKYPIAKMVLVDEYKADDNLSMADNNTSAFNYRVISGTTKLSNHAYGLAIDINPIQNPYVKGTIIEPSEGSNYLDRNIYQTGMILKDDVCYEAFTSKGWSWGGEWRSIKDYQHFEIYIEGIN